MNNEEIKVVIDADANVTVSVAGVKGKSCKDLTRQLEAALGTVTKDELTREAYEQPARNQIINRR